MISCCLLALAGCTPILSRTDYRTVSGAVGYQLHARTRQLCPEPEILTPAALESGQLPPGVDLGEEGNLYGTPEQPGQWQAIVRLPRARCGDSVQPDDVVGWKFEIAPEQ